MERGSAYRKRTTSWPLSLAARRKRERCREGAKCKSEINVQSILGECGSSLSSTVMIITSLRIPRATALRGIVRTLTSTPRCYNDAANGQGATKDPTHPNLYYHPSGQSTILSFLSSTPSAGSSTILGSLPQGGGLGDFKEEPKFLYAPSFLFADGMSSQLERSYIHRSKKVYD